MTHAYPCLMCDGTGQLNPVCDLCGGHGYVYPLEAGRRVQTLCPDCDNAKCRTCDGFGGEWVSDE